MIDLIKLGPPKISTILKINMSGALAENIFMSVDDDRKHASI